MAYHFPGAGDTTKFHTNQAGCFCEISQMDKPYQNEAASDRLLGQQPVQTTQAEYQSIQPPLSKTNLI